MSQSGSLIDQVLDRLDIVAFYRKELPGLKNGGGDEATVLCPFHEETTPSFSVNLQSGLYNCFGCGAKGNVFTFYQNRNGCDFKTALHDLARFAGVESEQIKGEKGLTLADLSSAKGLPVESLKKWGVANIVYKGQPAVYIPYRDLKGKTTDRFRLNLKQEPRLLWRKGSKTLLYGLWRLPEFRQGGEILLVEGETDCWTLWEHGIAALGLPGKTNWKAAWAAHLKDLKVFLWVEPDAPELPGKVARNIPGLLVISAPAGFKDISEAHLQGQDVTALISELKVQAKPPEPGGETTGGASVPKIIITKRFLNDKSNEAIRALETANNPPFLFRRSGTLARISLDEKDHPRIIALTDMQLRGILARHAHFVKETEQGLVATTPPMDLVKDILSLGEWSFPGLEGIVQAPALRPDGSVLSEAGYDPATSLYYVNPPNLCVPPIPESPTPEDVQKSIRYLKEIIQDFPFVEESDHANALGLLITLPLRPAIPGNIPMAVIQAPAPGTGKTLFVDTVAMIGTGRSAPMAGLPRDDDEMRKFITSRLLAGDPLISFDNLELPLWGPSLSRALTCTTWEDRILGGNTTARLPQRAVWVANGNNIKLRGDLPRRTFPIRVDAGLSRPWERQNFKHKSLCDWVLSLRGDFLAAIFTIGRGWFVAGKPEPKKPVPVMGGFTGWTQIIGGILSFAGVEGFLENLKQFHEEADLEGPEWETFLSTWVELVGEGAKTCQEVTTILRDNPKFAATLPDNLQNVLKDPEKSFERSLGRALARKEKRPYGEKNLALQRVNTTRDKVILWKVAPF